MTSRIIAGIVVAFLVVAGVWYFFFFPGPSSSTPGASSGQNPLGQPAPGVGAGTKSSATTSSSTAVVQDLNGASVSVPDFTAGRAPIYQGNQTYYDLSHVGPVYGDENSAFDILYGDNKSYFLITLLAEPLGQARLAAEAALRSTLGLPNDELCKLNMTVGVPYSVNQSYSTYQNLRLSFCPGATALPQ